MWLKRARTKEKRTESFNKQRRQRQGTFHSHRLRNVRWGRCSPTLDGHFLSLRFLIACFYALRTYTHLLYAQVLHPNRPLFVHCFFSSPFTRLLGSQSCLDSLYPILSAWTEPENERRPSGTDVLRMHKSPFHRELIRSHSSVVVSPGSYKQSTSCSSRHSYHHCCPSSHYPHLHHFQHQNSWSGC